jgi:hypothetical protein
MVARMSRKVAAIRVVIILGSLHLNQIVGARPSMP